MPSSEEPRHELTEPHGVSGGLTYSGFSLEGMTEAEALEIWRHAVPTHHLLSYAQLPGPGRHDWAQAWLLDQVILSPCQIGALHNHRTADLIEADGVDHYSVVLCVAGTWAGRCGEIDFEAGPGSAFVIDMAQPLELQMTGSRAIQIIAPRAMLDTAGPRRALHGQMLVGAMAEVLFNTVGAIARRLDCFSQADAATLAKVICDLVEASLPHPGPIEDDGPARVTLQARARQIVLSRLDDQALSPAQLAASLGISRTRLYAAMKASGGVAAFIQELRLRQAHAMLMRIDDVRRIGDVATAVGFPSPSAFSNAFRRYFGVRPRDLLSKQPDGPPTGRSLAGERPWSTWIRQLGR